MQRFALRVIVLPIAMAVGIRALRQFAPGVHDAYQRVSGHPDKQVAR